MSYKICVVGSRKFNNYEHLKRNLDDLILDITPWRGEVTLLSGGAEGADKLAEQYAEETGLEITVFPALWHDLEAPGAVIRENHHGKYNVRAGFVRNQVMAEEADLVVAFWDGKSSGTKDMISRAKKLGKEVVILYF